MTGVLTGVVTGVVTERVTGLGDKIVTGVGVESPYIVFFSSFKGLSPLSLLLFKFVEVSISSGSSSSEWCFFFFLCLTGDECWWFGCYYSCCFCCFWFCGCCCFCYCFFSCCWLCLCCYFCCCCCCCCCLVLGRVGFPHTQDRRVWSDIHCYALEIACQVSWLLDSKCPRFALFVQVSHLHAMLQYPFKHGASGGVMVNKQARKASLQEWVRVSSGVLFIRPCVTSKPKV